MNLQYHFKIFPDQMGRFKPWQVDALNNAIDKMRKDAAK